MKKTVFKLLIACMLASLLCVPVSALVERDESFYVTDSSNVLSSSLEELIINYNGALEQQCEGAQFVVVTVNYLDGMYSDEYALQLFNDWQVGDARENNGVLLLLAVEENKAWMTAGYGISHSLDDDTINDMFDRYFWDDFDSGSYNEAVESMMYAVLGWFDEYYDANVVASNPDYQGSASGGAYYDDGYNYYGPTESVGYRSGISLGTIVVVVLIIYFALSMPRRRRYYNTHGVWPALFFWSMAAPRRHHHHHDHFRGPRGPRGPGGPGGGFGGRGGGFRGGGGFGGGGRGGGFRGGGGFGGGMGRGGGGFGGGGGGRR